MVDFVEAFKEGQTAFEISKNNNQEIISVFKELNKQLKQIADGKIKISIDVTNPFTIDPAIKLKMALSPEKYRAIYAENFLIPNNPKKELAKWEQAREGYPCKITIGNKQHYCEDKGALENMLALMLQDPVVAETLTNLIKLN